MQRLTCPQGHQWEPSPDQDSGLGEPVSLCPICSGTNLLLPPPPTSAVALPNPITLFTPTASLPVPVIPGYEILKELGRGGMGVVYLARQHTLNRTVALKMVLAGNHANEEELVRFLGEAEAAAALRHPGIVQIYECGRHDGLPYFSLEYVPGGSLADRLKDGPLPPPEAARLVEQLAQAMDHAHQQGIVHRDLKPANVLLQKPEVRSQKSEARRKESGFFMDPGPPSDSCLLTSGSFPKITDFGLARRLTVGAGVTATGAVLGTPSYMAPEQAAGRGKQAGPAADVYALGAILYECLTGRPPFRAPTLYETLQQVIHDDAVSVRRLQPQVPTDLETICQKCLEKEPAKRYATAGELADDLRRFQAHEPIHARPVGTLERSWRWCRRNPLVVGLLSAVVLALLVGSGVATTFAFVAAARANAETAAKIQALNEKLRANQEKDEALRQLDLARRHLMTTQLQRVAAIMERDPGTAYALLHDPNLCPPDLRDFAWGWYGRCAKRDRLTLAFGGKVRALAWQPTSLAQAPMLASAGEDHTIRLWDMATGQEKATLNGHTSPVTSLAFSPDGHILASGGEDRTVRLWDMATKKEIAILKGHLATVSSVAFHPDGQAVASGSHDRTVKVWDVVTRQERHTRKGHKALVRSVAFSPDGQTLASGSEQVDAKTGWYFGEVKLWDLGTDQERTLKGYAGGTDKVVFSPDGKTLAATAHITVWLWDLATGQDRAVLKGHGGPIWSLAFSPDGKTIASGATDQTVRLWDVATGQERFTLGGHSGTVTAVAFSPDGHSLAASSFVSSSPPKGEVKWWDLRRPRERTLPGHGGYVSAVAFSPNGQVLASGGGDLAAQAGKPVPGEVHLWEVATWQKRGTLKGHKGMIRTVAFSPDGQTLASGSNAVLETQPGKDRPGELKLWDLVSRQERASLKGHDGNINCVAFSPDGQTLASGGGLWDNKKRAYLFGELKLWDGTTGEERATFKGFLGTVHCLAFSPDGQTLAVGLVNIDARKKHYYGEVQLWDLATVQKRALLKGATGAPHAVAFSPDGKTLAASSNDDIILWEMDSGDMRTILKGHASTVWSLVFSRDGKVLASASSDRTVRLWEVTTGQERASLQGHTGNVFSVAFSPTGHILASGGNGWDPKKQNLADGEVKVWETTPPKPHPTVTGN